MGFQDANLTLQVEQLVGNRRSITVLANRHRLIGIVNGQDDPICPEPLAHTQPFRQMTLQTRSAEAGHLLR